MPDTAIISNAVWMKENGNGKNMVERSRGLSDIPAQF